MPEVSPPKILRCAGCNRAFDNESDLAPARVGASLHQLCRRCYLTSLGPDNTLTFELAQEMQLS